MSKWCKHLVAVELLKRANERLYAATDNGSGRKPEPQPAPEPETVPAIADDCGRHWTDHGPPVVWHVEFVVDGVKHGVTVRCDDLQEVKAQVKEITAMVKKGREAESVPSEPAGKMCPVHNAPMTLKKGKWGEFYSHNVGGEWCKGKA